MIKENMIIEFSYFISSTKEQRQCRPCPCPFSYHTINDRENYWNTLPEILNFHLSNNFNYIPFTLVVPLNVLLSLWSIKWILITFSRFCS